MDIRLAIRYSYALFLLANLELGDSVQQGSEKMSLTSRGEFVRSQRSWPDPVDSLSSWIRSRLPTAEGTGGSVTHTVVTEQSEKNQTNTTGRASQSGGGSSSSNTVSTQSHQTTYTNGDAEAPSLIPRLALRLAMLMGELR
eukprot:CAMPEP_0169254280 /NCGR_PEP_ID=MMETSP1016-20121227/39082_1 /TAXON_ID=342587 /ORGANISM="Karlodinium micrum, Strain CCMP2283" /LENGTH=140 /DNA_ID=CAMNT_0009335713 /DNA_START=90 /DNA_END=510 /DNA_ORIENTATION=+